MSAFDDEGRLIDSTAPRDFDPDDNGSENASTLETTPLAGDKTPSTSFTTSAMDAILAHGTFAACHLIVFAASVVSMTRSDGLLYTFTFILSFFGRVYLAIRSLRNHGTLPLSRSHPRLLLLVNVLALGVLIAVAVEMNEPVYLNPPFCWAAFDHTVRVIDLMLYRVE